MKAMTIWWVVIAADNGSHGLEGFANVSLIYAGNHILQRNVHWNNVETGQHSHATFRQSCRPHHHVRTQSLSLLCFDLVSLGEFSFLKSKPCSKHPTALPQHMICSEVGMCLLCFKVDVC